MKTDRVIPVLSEEQISKLYDKWSTRLRSFLAGKYEDELVQAVLPETAERFDEFAADLPYIGGAENPMTNILVWSAFWLAVYQSLKEHGKNVMEVGALICEDFEQSLTAKYSKEQMLDMGQQYFTEEYIRQQKALALQSQQCVYEGDWKFSFIDGDGEEFDFGLDYTECPICTLYHKHGADELVQFICLTDFYTSEKFGLGLERNQTIADGFDLCNFRYKHRRETRMNWIPDFLK